MDNYKAFTGGIDDRRKLVSKKIDMFNDKVAKARDLYLSDKLDEDDYKEIKSSSKIEIERLEGELAHLVSENKSTDIQYKLEKAIEAVSNITKLYRQGDTESKQAIASSIFPNKLEYDGTTFRTLEMDQAKKLGS